MRSIDAAAIGTLGIPRLLLMDHAGLALARAVRTLTSASPAPIAVCCGVGFNGGDGLAAARHLHEWGYPLRILVAGGGGRARGGAAGPSPPPPGAGWGAPPGGPPAGAA